MTLATNALITCTSDAQNAHVVVLTLNRPDKLNALSQDLMQALTQAVAQYDANPAIRVLVLAGAGKVFAAGGDLQAMAQWTTEQALQQQPLEVWDALATCKKPIITAIHGLAYGGGLEIALMTDIIVAGESARLCMPEVKLGVIPGAGGTQRLTRILGKPQAMRFILSGQPITAAEAYQCGLVSQVVPDAISPETLPATAVLEAALQLARTIAENAPLAVQAAKQAILAAETGMQDGLQLERSLFYGLLSTHHRHEGMAAFLEKRPPVYD